MKGSPPLSLREKIRLIVNADDLGMDSQIDRGILRAHRDGIVTSASLLATGPTAREAVRQANEQGLPLGVHLCLTSRLPPALEAQEVPLLAPDGRFPRRWSDVLRNKLRGRIRLDEVEREFKAQLALSRRFGARVDHLDSHQHLHLLPGVAQVVHQIACLEQLPVRWPVERPRLSWLLSPHRALKSLALSSLALTNRDRGVRQVRAVGVYDSGTLNESKVLDLLSSLGPGDHELGCHPGLEVQSVRAEPNWRYHWDEELRALCSAKVKESLRARNIALISYADLAAYN